MNNVIRPLNIWLVGARDGYMPLAFPSTFDQCICVVAIEADNDCRLERIQLSDGRVPQVATRRLHACVAGTTSQRLFEIRQCPFASSMRQLDANFSEWSVFGNGICDYVLSHAHEPTHQSVLNTTTLDVLVTGEVKDQAPSVLVLDTQGASDEILINGAEVVLSHVDALVLEVELIPFFGGTPSFARLLPHLWRKGFVFVEFLEEDETWATPFRLPLGQRCRSLPGARDAVFLRLPDNLRQDGDPCRLSNYAIACAMLGRIDFALEALRNAPEQKTPGWSDDCPLESFAASLQAAVRQMPSVKPKDWKPPGKKDQVTPPSYLQELQTLSTVLTTPLEDTLTTFGFAHIAADIKSRRLRQARLCLAREHALKTA